MQSLLFSLTCGSLQACTKDFQMEQKPEAHSKHRMAEDKTFKIQGQQPGSHPLWLSPPSPGVFILSSQPPGERASWEVTRYGCTRPAACGTSPFMAGTLVHTQNWGIGLYAQTSKFLYWNTFLIPLVHELLEVVSYSTISATGCL